MSHLRILVSVLLCATLGAYADNASACKPHINDISQYVQNEIPNGVIFLGTVTSVKYRKLSEGTWRLAITFSVKRWFKGKKQKTILVSGLVVSMRRSHCAVHSDFSAKVGEEWLIFGQIREDKTIRPDRFLSEKLLNGEIPASILNQLK